MSYPTIRIHARPSELTVLCSCRRGTLVLTILTAILSLHREKVSCAAEMRRPPNVVIILADDLGWSDTTLYGTTKFYETPNIERLAARGMTFTHAYSASPLCSPTRASILTGLSPARTGITTPNCHLPQVVLEATPAAKGAPNVKAAPVNSVSRLNTTYYTLAEALKDAGYVTGHFGKWRSQVTFVADDGDYNEHLNDAEFLNSYLEREHANYNP
ncbi:MAG: sulfatase-like hydrolase/transferase, partial [Planctomycetia bacterium]|nr:sulfatase-like hydrolase/transferase [Planctomycetia bacterium]